MRRNFELCAGSFTDSQSEYYVKELCKRIGLSESQETDVRNVIYDVLDNYTRIIKEMTRDEFESDYEDKISDIRNEGYDEGYEDAREEFEDKIEYDKGFQEGFNKGFGEIKKAYKAAMELE
jgi:hypothetical protein